MSVTIQRMLSTRRRATPRLPAGRGRAREVGRGELEHAGGVRSLLPRSRVCGRAASARGRCSPRRGDRWDRRAAHAPERHRILEPAGGEGLHAAGQALALDQLADPGRRPALTTPRSPRTGARHSERCSCIAVRPTVEQHRALWRECCVPPGPAPAGAARLEPSRPQRDAGATTETRAVEAAAAESVAATWSSVASASFQRPASGGPGRPASARAPGGRSRPRCAAASDTSRSSGITTSTCWSRARGGEVVGAERVERLGEPLAGPSPRAAR